MAKANRYVFLLLLSLLQQLIFGNMESYAHKLTGIIDDEKGVSIPNATIFVREIAMGTISNIEGNYEIDLDPGIYTIVYRSLGYKAKVLTVDIETTNVELNVVLEEQLNEIQEVRVLGNGEDPAYPIMRKAIGLANFHLRQVNAYDSEVYMRARLKLTNVPRLIAHQLKKQEGIDIQEGRTYVDETFSKIQFSSPNTYRQTVLSHNTTLPAFKDISVMEYVGASFYQPSIEILISPFAPNAFSYYKFTYEGYNYDGDYTINIIRVTPRRKSKQLFRGYIHIIEELSCLHSVDLLFSTPFGDMKTKQIFEEVRPTVWLPIAHNYFFEGGALGLRGNIRYNANFKYKNIDLNKDLLALHNRSKAYRQTSTSTKQENITSSVTQKIRSQSKQEVKRRKKINQISKKDEITKSEMDKLNRLVEKQNDKMDREQRTSLEIIPKAKIEYLSESLTTNPEVWEAMRAIPLTEEEIQSFALRDSMSSVEQEGITLGNKVIKTPSFFKSLGRVVGGKKWTKEGSSWRFKYPGLFEVKNIVYNPVDGFNYGLSMEGTLNIKEGVSYRFEPKINYAFSREQFLWQMDNRLLYAPMAMGELNVKFGHQTSDFNNDYPINPFINSISSLFFQQSYKRYFGNKFINIENKLILAPGLMTEVEVNLAKRTTLENSTNFSFFDQKDDFDTNVPVNRELLSANLISGKSIVSRIKLSYTYEHFYKIKNGRKRMSNTKYPTIWTEYRKGYDFGKDFVSDFDYLEFGISQKLTTGPSAWLNYSARIGKFFNNQDVYFADFTHFNTRPVPVMINEPRNCFFSPSSYELSTQDQVLEGHVWYRAPYILLKRIPGFSNSLIREQVWASYYTNIDRKHLWEVGYALTEVLFIGDVGVYAGFEEENFRSFGIYFHIDI